MNSEQGFLSPGTSDTTSPHIAGQSIQLVQPMNTVAQEVFLLYLKQLPALPYLEAIFVVLLCALIQL